MGRASKDRRDIFYRLAKEEGWRARSAFKLIHINNYFNIFQGVRRAVDLCAAPGSWSQVLAQQLHKNNQVAATEAAAAAVEGIASTEESYDVSAPNQTDPSSSITQQLAKNSIHDIRSDVSGTDAAGDVAETRGEEDGVIIADSEATVGAIPPVQPCAEVVNPDTFIVAVDLQTMAPIPGVTCIKGDITDERTATEIIRQLGNAKAQLVVCDGAPDVTGIHDLDEFLQGQLLYSALTISTIILEEGGTFIAKMFRASKDGVECIYSRLSMFFESVILAKPKACRLSSIECYVVCRKFKLPEGFKPEFINPFAVDYSTFRLEDRSPQTRMYIQFVSCEDINGYCADTTYPLNYDPKTRKSLPPVQPPIDPPYAEALRRRKAGLLGLTDEEIEEKLAKQKSRVRPKNKTPKTPKQPSVSSTVTQSIQKSPVNPEDNEEGKLSCPVCCNFKPRARPMVNVSFGGGIENLLKKHYLPMGYELAFPGEIGYPVKIGDMIEFIGRKVVENRPELFIKDGSVTPGILVLVNDVDWELLGGLEYEFQDKDNISFISTLHGG